MTRPYVMSTLVYLASEGMMACTARGLGNCVQRPALNEYLLLTEVIRRHTLHYILAFLEPTLACQFTVPRCPMYERRRLDERTLA